MPERGARRVSVGCNIKDPPLTRWVCRSGQRAQFWLNNHEPAFLLSQLFFMRLSRYLRYNSIDNV